MEWCYATRGCPRHGEYISKDPHLRCVCQALIAGVKDYPRDFALIAAERMADAINRLVLLHKIDSRSEAADAALGFADPDFERMREVDTLRTRLSQASALAESLSLRDAREVGKVMELRALLKGEKSCTESS